MTFAIWSVIVAALGGIVLVAIIVRLMDRVDGLKMQVRIETLRADNYARRIMGLDAK